MAVSKKKIEQLIGQIECLQKQALDMEQKFETAIRQAHPAFKKSARNLLHYLALRHHDIRGIQESLAKMGLSSLGRTESHVLASLEAVRKQLCFLTACDPPQKYQFESYTNSHKLLQKHTANLMGKAPEKRGTRIMVTFSTDMATDYDKVCRLLLAGMNCARINCAHDSEKVWLQMIRNIRKAEKEMKLPCKILMDLMGPKLRTGNLKPGPKLLAIHPIRNEIGRVIAPANVWLSATDAEPPLAADVRLPVEKEWLVQLQEGDLVLFLDTRGRKRKLSIIKKNRNGVLGHLFKTSYVATGTRLSLKNSLMVGHVTSIGELPELVVPLILKKDDFLVLHKALIPGEPATYDATGHVISPAHISCTLPQVFSGVKAGQQILFNDGHIEGQIQEVDKDQLLIKITAAREKGNKLRADQGINLPDSDLDMNGLTEKDKHDLCFIIKHADIVNLSFVNHPDTVFELQETLKTAGAADMGIMLKIETKEGFRNLPHILLAAMRTKLAGIMIARGDLAVECGWMRLAEVQEEILWLCEAGHMPVVWATQVLENLAKKGRPSRAEITDAAMAQRADCVMLNKGPHVVQAIKMLDEILKIMQEHQQKKTSMLRNLHVSDMEHIAGTQTARNKPG